MNVSLIAGLVIGVLISIPWVTFLEWNYQRRGRKRVSDVQNRALKDFLIQSEHNPGGYISKPSKDLIMHALDRRTLRPLCGLDGIVNTFEPEKFVTCKMCKSLMVIAT